MCISWNSWWRCSIAPTSKICLDWHQKCDFELNSNIHLRHSCNQNMQNIVTWGQNMSANIEEFACISMGGLFSGVPPYKHTCGRTPPNQPASKWFVTTWSNATCTTATESFTAWASYLLVQLLVGPITSWAIADDSSCVLVHLSLPLSVITTSANSLTVHCHLVLSHLVQCNLGHCH